MAAKLQQYIEMLPTGTWAPAAPFGGYVLNLGGATTGHIDRDFGLCFVIIFGTFSGGELALHECKLLLRFKGFTIVAFLSKELTHFNTHYKGKRISLVLQTEDEAVDWVEFLNKWSSYLMD